MRTLLLGLIVAVAVTTGLTSAALAINDPKVPANECSSEESVAVGDPFEGANPGIAQAEPVSPAVSANNPGVSTGAKGQVKSQALENCRNNE